MSLNPQVLQFRAAPCRQRRRCSSGPAATAATADATAAAAATRVVVIGGGVGGLSVAGRLARAGLEVTVLEKNKEVGCCVCGMEGIRTALKNPVCCPPVLRPGGACSLPILPAFDTTPARPYCCFQTSACGNHV